VIGSGGGEADASRGEVIIMAAESVSAADGMSLVIVVQAPSAIVAAAMAASDTGLTPRNAWVMDKYLFGLCHLNSPTTHRFHNNMTAVISICDRSVRN